MSSYTVSSVNLVDQILEQGQRLRNSIVQSILNNDPLNSEIILSTERSTANVSEILELKNDEYDANKYTTMKNQIEAYLQGEQMSPQEEHEVLAAIQSMSAQELCKTTEKTYASYNNSCNCNVCKQYETQNLNCDLQRSTKPNTEVPLINLTEKDDENTGKSVDIVEFIKNTYRSQTADYLQYIDSLQVAVHSLTLSDAGLRKVATNDVDKKSKVPAAVSHTYFVEYTVPSVLQKNSAGSTRSVFSVDRNCVRICSRKLNSNG